MVDTLRLNDTFLFFQTLVLTRLRRMRASLGCRLLPAARERRQSVVRAYGCRAWSAPAHGLRTCFRCEEPSTTVAGRPPGYTVLWLCLPSAAVGSAEWQGRPAQLAAAKLPPSQLRPSIGRARHRAQAVAQTPHRGCSEARRSRRRPRWRSGRRQRKT